MTALLLCCLAQLPADDRAVFDHQRRVTAAMVEASQHLQDDPARVVSQLTALLDDPEGQRLAARSPVLLLHRDQLVTLRAEARLKLGEAQAVADEMTAILDQKRAAYAARVAALVGSLAGLDPGPRLGLAFAQTPWQPLLRWDWIGPLSYRARAWEALGRPDLAAADNAAYQAALREMQGGFDLPDGDDGFDYVPAGHGWFASLPPWPFSWTATLAVAFVALVPAFVLLGRRQRREAGGSWLRLVGVAVVLAALQVLPVAAAVVVGQYVQGEPATGRLVVAAAVVSVVTFITLRANLVPMVWTETGDAVPALEDPAVLGRIRELAEAMGVHPPVARLVRSASSEQLNQAQIGGLAAPTLLVYDGILNRLSDEERDAILAHELAHLANRTLWLWLALGAACAVAVVVAAPFFYPLVLFTFGAALWFGSSLILTRWLELDCDRRAARAIGHTKTASALFKIHADEPYRSSPVLEFLIGATADHPSRDERLAAIHADAPAGDKPPVEWHPGGPERRRLAAWLAALLWLGGIAACLAAARMTTPDPIWPALPLFLIAATPIGLILLGVRKAWRRQGRLQKKPFQLRSYLGVAYGLLLVTWLLAEWSGWSEEVGRLWLALAFLAGSALFGLASLVLGSNSRAEKLNQKLGVAIHAGDWAKALEHCESDPDLVATSDDLRYNQALIKAVLGRRDDGTAELERLRADRPHYKMTWLALISIYTDEGRFAEALALANDLTTALPGDALGPLIESWLLRKLGRADEAEAAVRAGLKAEPDAAQGSLTRAGLAVDRGDVTQARRELERAERHSPGTVPVLLMAVEVALVAGDPDVETLLAKARQAVRTTPLAFAEKELAALEERIAPAPVVELAEDGQ